MTGKAKEVSSLTQKENPADILMTWRKVESDAAQENEGFKGHFPWATSVHIPLALVASADREAATLP
jgi:hypothetical protein